jgi:hypothetical protein
MLRFFPEEHNYGATEEGMTVIPNHKALWERQRISLSFLFLFAILMILIFVPHSSAVAIKGRISSVRGDVIQFDLGSDKGIREGDAGRVYYNVKIDEKEKPIYVAKFKITRVSDRSATGQIQEKTTDVRTGFLVEITVSEGELDIKSEPAGAKVFLNGREVGAAPLVLPFVKPGEYTVRLVREGYQTYEEKVNVTEGEKTRIVASMKRAVGALSVNTNPPGAAVSLDGQSVGASPYEGKDLSAKSYKIRVTMEGYEPWEKGEIVEIGKKTEVLAQLKPSEGSLEIVSEPPGAKIFIDGNEIGESPFLAAIRPGQYAIRVLMEGYLPFEEKVDVQGKERKKISAVLSKPVGELIVRTQPPGAAISIDGRPAGITPYEGRGLPPGTYKIRIEKEGYGTWEGVLAVIPGRKVDVPIELKARVGDLEIGSDPPGAKVYVNRKEMGQTPFFLREIPVGPYSVRLVKEGYEVHEETAGVIEGQQKKVEVKLTRIVGELSIRTDPPGASIYIDGKLFGTSPYQGRDLSPGAYEVRIVMEGYVPWQGVLAVIAGKKVEVPVELKAKLGQLDVSSEPGGAKVYLDGKEMGQTPVSLPGIRVGTRQVRVTKEGYESHEEQVKLGEGRNRVSVSLKRLRGDLSVGTDPIRSEVYINGRSVGPSPYEGKDLQPGTYKVKAVREGYEAREMDVVVRAGETGSARIELKEKKKEIAVQPPSPLKPEAPREKEASKPAAAANEADLAKKSYEAPLWNIGSRWTYRGKTGKTWTDEVTEWKDDLFVIKAGETQDRQGFERKSLNCPFVLEGSGKRVKNTGSLRNALDFPLSVGKGWKDRTSGTHRGKFDNYDVSYFTECKVQGVEKVETPAGTFPSYKIRCLQREMGILQIEGRPGSGTVYYWYSPEVKNWVKREFDQSGHWPDSFQNAVLASYELR